MSMSKSEKLEYAVEIVVANIGKGTPSDWQHAFALARQATKLSKSSIEAAYDRMYASMQPGF